MNKRLIYNIKIINKLISYIYENPDLRLGQILVNLNIIEFGFDKNDNIKIKDPFYDEPEVIYKRMISRLN